MGQFLGRAVSTAGQVSEDNYQAGLARINQALAGQAADSALDRGGYEAGLAQMRGSQLASKQAVGYAASGVDPSVGTPLQAMADTRMMSTLDAQLLKNNAAREAWGYKVQGYQYGAQALLDQRKANNDLAAGVVGMGGDLVSAMGALK